MDDLDGDNDDVKSSKPISVDQKGKGDGDPPCVHTDAISRGADVHRESLHDPRVGLGAFLELFSS